MPHKAGAALMLIFQLENFLLPELSAVRIQLEKSSHSSLCMP